MNEPNVQLVNYIQSKLNSGAQPADIRSELVAAGWTDDLINNATAYISADTANRKKRSKRGVLWILSPFIVLMCVVVLSTIVRFADIKSPILDVPLLLAGVAGVILIFAGPIIGIITLSRK